MGTNYHWLGKEKAPCASCGRLYEREEIHIGKSSAGWCFSLHVTEEIRTLDDWKKKFKEPGHIEDEYGEEVSVEKMLSIICDRGGGSDRYPRDDRWYEKNYAKPGPNGLVRHSTRRCVGHGEGPWDYLEGEFS